MTLGSETRGERLFWQESRIDHRRLGVAHAQIYVDAQSDGQFVDQQC